MSLQLTDAPARKWTEAAFLRQNCKSRHQLLAEAFVRENKQRVAHWEVLLGREGSCQVLERGEVATWRKVLLAGARGNGSCFKINFCA